jgi:hypothetical protein
MSHRVFDKLMTYATIHHPSRGVFVGSWETATGANSYIINPKHLIFFKKDLKIDLLSIT